MFLSSSSANVILVQPCGKDSDWPVCASMETQQGEWKQSTVLSKTRSLGFYAPEKPTGDRIIWAPRWIWSAIQSLGRRHCCTSPGTKCTHQMTSAQEHLCTALRNPISCWWWSLGRLAYKVQPRDLVQWCRVDMPSLSNQALPLSIAINQASQTHMHGLLLRISEVMACLCKQQSLRSWNPPPSCNAFEVCLHVLKSPFEKRNHFRRRILSVKVRIHMNTHTLITCIHKFAPAFQHLTHQATHMGSTGSWSTNQRSHWQITTVSYAFPVAAPQKQLHESTH